MSIADEIAKLHELVSRGALTPEEFERAKSRLLEAAPGPWADLSINRLRLSATDKWIAGVCGGIARLTGVSIRDNGCSLKAYRRSVLEGVRLYGLPPGERRPGSVGLPAGSEIAIVDGDGARLAPGMPGEVLGTGVAAGDPAGVGGRSCCYLLILVTWPAPTVRPPSRMANFRPSSMAMG